MTTSRSRAELGDPVHTAHAGGGELVARLGPTGERAHLEPGAEQTPDQRSPHLAGADDADARISPAPR